MNTTLYLSFVATSLVVLALPGPSFAYAVAIGIRATRREIVLNAVGMGLGGLVIALAVAFGVARVFAASQAAFTALKLLGCAYLVVLGVQTFVARPAPLDAPAPRRTGAASPLLQGFIVETANPKAILFYVSLLPQFVDHTLGHLSLQLLVLGATFVPLQVAWDVGLMFGVLRVRTRLARLMDARRQRWANRASGTAFVALGAALLLQERPR